MKIAYGTGAYRRDTGNLPDLRLVNMFLERGRTAQDGYMLQQRPGLTSYFTAGVGPMTGIFSQNGVLGNDIFSVSAGMLYRQATALGAVSGAGKALFAASAAEVLVTGGSTLYRSDGVSGCAQVSFPDGADVSAVAFLADYFVAIRSGSQKYYWSALLDGTSWDALDFASAESSPDNLLDIKVVGDELWLLGASTIEPHFPTGDLDAPFQRSEGRIYRRGVYARGCCAALDNTLLIIGDDGIVYRLAQIPERLSDNGIEEQIAASSEVSAFAFEWEGHKFFCVRLDTITLGCDVASGEWCEFASYGEGNWRAIDAVTVDGKPYFADAVTGRISAWSGLSDDGTAIERIFTAAQRISGKPVTIHTLNLTVNVGATPLLEGQGSDPIIEMRTSRDGGKTFAKWRSTYLGGQGDYRVLPGWRRLGQFDEPGFLAQFRVTDPVPFRVSGVVVNEGGGGRARRRTVAVAAVVSSDGPSYDFSNPDNSQYLGSI